MRIDEKIIVSGNVIEYYAYENSYFLGYQLSDKEKERLGRSESDNSGLSIEDKENNRIKVLRRARRDLRRIINSNVYKYKDKNNNIIFPKFLTLTYADNVQNIKKSNLIFKNFMKRFNYYLYKNNYFERNKSNLKYSAVIEFQKRGAIHYHIVFYNLPFLSSDIISKIWGQGFVKINKIDNVDNVGAYVCKYMSKDNFDSRLVGQKCYFNSRNLFKPIEIVEKKEIKSVVDSLSSQKFLNYHTVFNNDYLGHIVYKQYNIFNKDNK